MVEGQGNPTIDVIEANRRSLNSLERAISLSGGQFSLVLACCNYGTLRELILQQLRQQLRVRGWDAGQIQIINLPSNVVTLYTTIHLQETVNPAALMVVGLDTVDQIDDLLSSINQIRDEFRKRHSFPMIVWVNDRVLQKMLRLAPDFASWAATPIRFEMTSRSLLEFLQQQTDALFARVLSTNNYQNNQIQESYSSVQEIWVRSDELRYAIKELEDRGISLETELNASLQFVFGLDDYICDQINLALTHFQESLRIYQQQTESNEAELGSQEYDIFPTASVQFPTANFLKQGVLQLYIGLCYCRLAEQNQTTSKSHWEVAKTYFQQCLQTFKIARRVDLVAEFIGQLTEVLLCLQDWSQLQIVAQDALELHQNYGNKIQLAGDYGYLAQVAIQESRWMQAGILSHIALLQLREAQKQGESSDSLFPLLLGQVYYLTLVKSQQMLGKQTIAAEYLQKATRKLHEALANSQHQYNAHGYIRLLRTLRSLYFAARCYREAYIIRQKRRSVEQQYGLRAFIGAGRLQPQRQATNRVLISTTGSNSVALEITASGRENDINQLIARISRADQKLTVIHGPSGVGKSSTVTAGLVPALQNRAIGDQIAIPVVLQIYTDWMRELGKSLTEAISIHHPVSISDTDTPNTLAEIWHQLQENAHNDLITVLIFDQFEEFFFGYTNLKQKQEFDRFISDCLNISFVKIILSLREDYLHRLLEFKHLSSLEAINNNILDKNIRYPLNNFSPEYAKIIINKLTARSEVHLEPDLIDALVADLSAELGEVRPIELQLVGAQLQDERITTLAQYEPYRPNKLIERYIKELIKDCGSENEHTALIILYLLTNESNNRPFKTRAELASELAELAGDSELDLVLDILVLSGLVVLFPGVPERYQLIHDYLVELIRYLQQQESSLQIQLDQLRDKVKNSQKEIERLQNELKQNNYPDPTLDIIPQTGGDIVTELRDLRKQEELSRQEIEHLRAELIEEQLTAQLIASREQQRLSEAKFNKVVKVGFGALFGLAILAILVLGAMLRRDQNREVQAISLYSSSLFASQKGIDALKEGLKAGNELTNFLFSSLVDTQTREQALTVLYQAVYGIKEINRLEGHTSGVNSIAFSPDKSLLVSGSADTNIKIWRPNGSLVRTLTGHKDVVNCVSFSPDSQMIASASQDKTIKLWSRDGKLIRTLLGHTSFVNSVKFSPDGNLIASAGTDKTIKLWNRYGKLVKTLFGHQDAVLDVAWSPDNRMIASASADNTIKLWSRDGKLLQTLIGHDDAVRSVAWTPNSQTLASASLDKTIKIWNRQGMLLRTLSGHNEGVISVAFSPDGETLASASVDNTIRLWSIDGALLETLSGHGNWVNSVTFSPDSRILASASRDKTIKFWRWDDVRLQSQKNQNDWVTSVSFSPDDKFLVAGNRDKTVKIWSPEGKLQKVLTGHKDQVWGVAWSPDGRTIASGSADKTVKLWSRDGQLINTLKGHEATVLAVAWSPNSQILASASKDKTIKLWNRDGKLLKTLLGHSDAVNWVSFSPDGKLLASASDDSLVKVWDIRGKFLYDLAGHTQRVNGVAWSPDSQILVSVSNDSIVNIWHRDGSLQTTIPGDGDSFNSISFSHSGRIFAVSTEDQIQFFNLEGDLTIALKGDRDQLTSIVFDHNGKLLAAGSSNGIVFRKRSDVEQPESLVHNGCAILTDYLQYNPNVTESDRAVCSGK